MRGLAYFRIGLGAFAWIVPRTVNRIFGMPRAVDSAALIYMNPVFRVRAGRAGAGYLASRGEARDLWHRLWLLCDTADTAMGAAMIARGRLGALTAVQAVAITGGATAIDLAAMGTTREPQERIDAADGPADHPSPGGALRRRLG